MKIGDFRVKPNTQDCVRTAGVGCVSAAPRLVVGIGYRPTVAARYDNASCRGFAYRAACAVRQAEGSYFAKLLTLQNRANVKDHAPQDITLVASLLYQKTAPCGVANFGTPPRWRLSQLTDCAGVEGVFRRHAVLLSAARLSPSRADGRG